MPTPKQILSDPKFHEISNIDTKKEILGHIDSNFIKQSPTVQDEIINHSKSLLATMPIPSSLKASQKELSLPSALARGAANLIPDIGRVGKDIVKGFSPYGSEGWRVPPIVKGVESLGLLNVPFLPESIYKQPDLETVKNTWSALGGSLIEKYGSYSNFKKSFAEKPAEVLSDISTIATAGGTAISKAGALSKLPTLTKMGKFVSKTGGAIEPLNVITKPIKYIGKKTIPPLTGRAIEEAVGKQLVATLDTGEPIFAGNLTEARKLESKFPGLKFSYAQATDFPPAIAAEKGLTSTTEAGKIAKGMQQATTDEAILNRLQKEFTGTENIGDVIESVGKREKEITRAGEVAGISSERAAQALKAQRLTPEESGITILGRAKTFLSEGRKKAEDLFGKIDDKIVVPSEPLVEVTNLIKKQRYKTDQMPLNILQRIEELTQSDLIGKLEKTLGADALKKANILDEFGKPLVSGGKIQLNKVPYGDLRDLRSDISKELRLSVSPEDGALRERLADLKKGVDRTLNQLSKESLVGKENASLYKQALSYYKNEYVPKFKQRTTAEILGRTKTGVQKVDDALLAGEYFKSGKVGIQSARDFKKTFGTDAIAQKAIRDYAINDLLSNSLDNITGEISTPKMLSWMRKNEYAVKEYKLWDEFRDFRNKRKIFEEAKQTRDVFNKGHASQVLGVNPDKAIENIIGKGRKESVAAAKEVMSIIDDLRKSDIALADKALKGLHNATKDYIVSKVKTTLDDLSGQTQLGGAAMARLMDDIDQPLQVVFKNNPSKLTALRETRRVLDNIRRASRNLPGGSETIMFAAGDAGKLRKIISHGGVTAKILDMTHGLLKKHSNKKIEELLVNAYYNPDIAESLMSVAKNKMSEKTFLAKWSSILTPTTSGIELVKSAAQEKTTEPQNITNTTYKSAISELQNRAKTGNSRIRDFFKEQGIGWGI